MITAKRQNYNHGGLMRAMKSSHSVFTYKGIKMVNLKDLAITLQRTLEITNHREDFAETVTVILDDILEKDWKEANAHSFTYRGMVGATSIRIHVKKDRVYNPVNEEWMTTYTF